MELKISQKEGIMRGLRVVVLISSDTSDIYFANQLIKKLNVVGVFVEKQWEKPSFFTKILKIPRFIFKPLLIKKRIYHYLKTKPYYTMCRALNQKYFGQEGETLFFPKNCKITYTKGCKDINNPVYVEKICKLNPDVIAVCGTSVLHEPIINIPPKGILNLHGGLAQQYRGICTTLWAVYNEEPEYVGATVHYVNKKIDDGNIIYQGRPKIVVNDNSETLYIKVVKLGIKMMTKAIDDIQNGTVKAYEQKGDGTLYLEKRLTAEIIIETMKKVLEGVILEYLENQKKRDDKVIAMMQGIYIENE